MKHLLQRYSILFLGVTTLLFARSEPELDIWYPFTPDYQFNQSVFGLTHWIEAPAGRHGFVCMDHECLVFEDGTPIKFWGSNLCSHLPYMNHAKADSFAGFLSHYGNNAVRLHKFTWHGYADHVSTKLDSQKFERLDYFQAALRKKGLYYGWSHIYGHRVQPGDSSKLIAYQEVKNLNYPWAHLNGSTSGLVNFAPDLQDLSIALTVNMLNHVNPYTGLRYAEDPALAFIEFQNEDNIFWSAIEKSLEQAPAYRAMLCRQFSQWLAEKYGSQQALEKAWGKETLPEGESIDKANIYPQPNHGLFDWAYKRLIHNNIPIDRHLLDKMRFLYETQLSFYQRFESAIRATGYRGVLIGSCWQAGSGIAHYYNLAADYAVGMIDRHNYFGGGAGGHQLKTGTVKNSAMIEKPGSGLLSAGSQQLADRPFAFSEWMSLVPNEWTAEAAPLIALYGMGLQGWDASFSFAADLPRFSRLLESERHGVYNATSPLHFGLYPALARMVYRQDVIESPVIAARNVHISSLDEGLLGFEELVKQGHDVKVFTGTVSSECMAIGRFPARFTDAFEETVIPDLSEYWNPKDRLIQSVTEQLHWHYGNHPRVTVNTDGSKGLIGFAENEVIQLDDWTVVCSNPFAVILLTDLSSKGDLKTARQILLTAVSRARNTGMAYEYAKDETRLVSRGRMPLLLEAVEAHITLPKSAVYTVESLTHDGVPTGSLVRVEDGAFVISGQYQTPYYLIVRQG